MAALIADLARAEAALRAALPEGVDAIVHPSGAAYLLQQAQLALIESEEREKTRAALLETILTSAPDSILYLELDGSIRWVNRGFPGVDVDVIGTHWHSYAREGERAALQRAFDEAVRTRLPVASEAESWATPGDEPRWVSRRFCPVLKDDEVAGVVVMSRDETEYRRAQSQLILAERMASLGTLAAGVAHEINNPLTSVVFNLDLIAEGMRELSQEGPLIAQLLDGLADARVGAERVAAIAQDLKLFSRRSEEGVGPVDVESVLDSTLRLAWNELRHRARLVKSYQGVPLVEANEGRLGQVFLNLVMNAVQALPDAPEHEGVIRISTAVVEGRVVVSIADNGPGIPAEVQSQLFTPFFTTKRDGTGTGLGLSICRRIVTGLRGSIEFSSPPGQGTEFRVALPMAAGPAVAAGPREVDTPRAAPRARIMIVDDEELIDRAMTRALAGEHDVTFLRSAADAVALLRKGERFDVVFCDLLMPEITGMDLYETVHALDAEQAGRIIFMTGGAFTPRARAFLRAGTHRCIHKPLTLTGLRSLVAEQLQRTADLPVPS